MKQDLSQLLDRVSKAEKLAPRIRDELSDSIQKKLDAAQNRIDDDGEYWKGFTKNNLFQIKSLEELLPLEKKLKEDRSLLPEEKAELLKPIGEKEKQLIDEWVKKRREELDSYRAKLHENPREVLEGVSKLSRSVTSYEYVPADIRDQLQAELLEVQNPAKQAIAKEDGEAGLRFEEYKHRLDKVATLSAQSSLTKFEEIKEFIDEDVHLERPLKDQLIKSANDMITITRVPPKTTFRNMIGTTMVLIGNGRFKMGAAKEKREWKNAPDAKDGEFLNEAPEHTVRITNKFYIGMYDVTQQEYEKIMNMPSGPSEDAQHPVVNVTWNDAVDFCSRLSQKERKKYRLPTEAEWEYACRADTVGRFNFGDRWHVDKANCDATRAVGLDEKGDARSLMPVGTFDQNPWLLYDMHGNVWQWCSDWYSKDYYRNSPDENPQGPDKGTTRVIRGGSWKTDPIRCRSAARNDFAPGQRRNDVGFRIVTMP